MGKKNENSIRSLEELDKEINEYEAILNQLESIIKAYPIPIEVPDELANFAFTPMSTYKHVQRVLAEKRSRRMELIMQEDSKTRLEYELKIALEKEDYKKARSIKNELNS